jgi:hypothetical protein
MRTGKHSVGNEQQELDTFKFAITTSSVARAGQPFTCNFLMSTSARQPTMLAQRRCRNGTRQAPVREPPYPHLSPEM